MTGDIEILDKWAGKHIIDEKTEEKYLGDIISVDGRNIKNIRARISKGKGILIILDGIPFGKLYFEIGLDLLNSLLVSNMVFN